MDIKNVNQLSVNTILGNRYIVGLVLGSSHLGITYMGYDNTENKKVAIREFFPEEIATRNENMVLGKNFFADGLQQFIQEGNILKGKKNLSGIVEVFDVIEQNGTAYIIMEYIEGTSLEDIVKSGRLFPIKRMQDLLEPILKSLYELHEKGLIHGNISPDNLIFTNEGTLKLIGFGCQYGRVSAKSKGYAPKELYDIQEDRKPRMDVYSVCAVIYYCITGKIPKETIHRTEQEELAAPSSLGVELSEAQETIILMGLSIKPEERLQGMQALYRALYGVPVSSEEKLPVNKTAVTEPEIKQEPVITKPVQEQVFESPQQIQKQQSVQENIQNVKKQEKKKGVNPGLIIGLCVVFVLLVVMTVGAVIAFRLYVTKTSVNTLDKETTEIVEKIDTLETAELSLQETVATVETDKLQEIRDILESQNYVGTIDMVIALSDEEKADYDEAEIRSVLEQAVEGVKKELIIEIDNFVNAAKYDEAFSAITDGITYFEMISENEILGNLADVQFLQDKEKEIQKKHKDYLSATAESCANQGDESGMEIALADLSSYIGTEEMEAKRIKCYGKLVVAKMTQMRNSGSSTEEILSFIKENLAKTDNNCWVLEFWDYYNTVYAMESGKGISTDTTIKHVSKSGYLLDDSNSVKLTTDDIKHLTEYEIYLALYEIYARHGRGFNDASVTSYFSQYSWYQETTRPEVFDESILNEYEKHNRDLIVEYQYTMGYR